MFVFKPTRKTYTDPVSATFTLGIPFGREYSKGDVCLLHEELSGAKIILNSKMLREALLDSKEFFRDELHLNIEALPEVAMEETLVENIPTEVLPEEAKPEKVKPEEVVFPEILDEAPLEAKPKKAKKTSKKKEVVETPQE